MSKLSPAPENSPPAPAAVILAAGRGNRLLPLTEDRPKCLMVVGGKTILEHQVRALRMAGVRTIQVVTGHGVEKVHEHCNGLTLYAHNPEFDTTNSFDSFGCVTLDPGPEGLLVLNSDVLFHPALLPRLIADERENVLLADFREGMGEEEMKIVVDANHRLRHVSKVIDPHKAHAENLGVLKLGQTAANRMIQLARSRGRESKIRWVPDGIHFLRDELEFYALPIGELPWTEIDYLHDLDRAEREIFPKIADALWG